MEELTQEILKELLSYNQFTGIFIWKEREIEYFNHCKNPNRACKIWNIRFANQEAGNIWTSKTGKTSYIKIGISLNGEAKKYLAHRLAFLYTEGHFPSQGVDHIDGRGLNNKRDNLREVSAIENLKNMPMRSDNTSGCVGVYWHKPTQKWRVYINVGEKNIHGGLFKNKADAIVKRKEMEIQYKFHLNHGREGEK